jgi:hypothetical protein
LSDKPDSLRIGYMMGARHLLLNLGMVETLDEADAHPEIQRLATDFDRWHKETEARIDAVLEASGLKAEGA